VILANTPADDASALQGLDRGDAIVIPFPSPLPYAVAATTRAAVNLAKGRPAQQSTGILLADFELITAHLELASQEIAFAVRMATAEAVNVMLPLRGAAPAWLTSCAEQGVLGVTLAVHPRVRTLMLQHSLLHISSANRAREPVATTAPAADAAFGRALLVLDGDSQRTADSDQGSSAIVEVRSHREVRVLRPGVQMRRSHLNADAYGQHLERTYR
jgi:tRNA A37 threonylcarbamoyladenosine synthetase subunit TsaC/SUA5/YrdC